MHFSSLFLLFKFLCLWLCFSLSTFLSSARSYIFSFIFHLHSQFFNIFNVPKETNNKINSDSIFPHKCNKTRVQKQKAGITWFHDCFFCLSAPLTPPDAPSYFLFLRSHFLLPNKSLRLRFKSMLPCSDTLH